MMLKISSELAQEVLNYLQLQPFKDVFQLINKMVKLETLDETPARSMNGDVPRVAEQAASRANAY